MGFSIVQRKTNQFPALGIICLVMIRLKSQKQTIKRRHHVNHVDAF